MRNRLLLGAIMVLTVFIGAWALLANAQEDSDVPMVSPDQACVDSSEIHFDTFDGRSVSFDEASDGTILRLRDAIPPIDDPQYTNAVEADDWLSQHDFVLGYEAPDGQAYAYPFKIMNFHEIVNEEFDGVPVLISYCPLCRSALVFSRELEGEVLTFGNTSALYNSDMVMYDHQTGSYWHQVGGEGIVGPLCEQRLDLLPSFTIKWGEWKELQPETLVLSQDTGFNRNYDRDPFSNYQDFLNDGHFAFPVNQDGHDARLDPGEIVLAVEIDDVRRAYAPVELGDRIVKDTVARQDVVIFSDGDGRAATAFFPLFEEMPLTFELVDGNIMDVETGSRWNMAGEAIEGELTGAQLEPVPNRVTFWFAIVATYPDIEVYGSDE